jgi:hypothetical protein
MGASPSKQLTETPPKNEKSKYIESVRDTVDSVSNTLEDLSIGVAPLSSDGSLSIGNLEEWESEVSQVRVFRGLITPEP